MRQNPDTFATFIATLPAHLPQCARHSCSLLRPDRCEEHASHTSAMEYSLQNILAFWGGFSTAPRSRYYSHTDLRQPSHKHRPQVEHYGLPTRLNRAYFVPLGLLVYKRPCSRESFSHSPFPRWLRIGCWVAVGESAAGNLYRHRPPYGASLLTWRHRFFLSLSRFWLRRFVDVRECERLLWLRGWRTQQVEPAETRFDTDL